MRRATLTNEKAKYPVYCLFSVLLGLSLSCINLPQSKPAENQPVHRLVVLHTNDTHGHPVKFFKAPAPDVGGLPARATLVRKIREKNRNVLVLDAGDINTGRIESNFFRARPDIEGYNYIGYDAIAVGNHEFDHPVDELREQIRLAEFPFLSANVKTMDGEYLAQPFIVKKFQGFNVAIFGLTTKETAITGNSEHIKNLVFEDEVEVAGKLVPELKKMADIIIALVHMGIYPVFTRGSKRLAMEVDGIDLVVDGHTHTKLESPIVIKKAGSDRKTIIVQAWKWGLLLGRVDLWIQDKRVKDFKFETIPVNLKTVKKDARGNKVYAFVGEEIEEDKRLLKILQPYVDRVGPLSSEVIGYADETFSAKNVRKRETALGNLVADSMLWFTKNLGTDFALQNGGGIRTDLPEGPITRGLIYEMLPFDNTVVVLTMKGSEVLSLFDYIANVAGGRGAFPQVSEGLSFTIDYTAGRCVNLLINGQPVDPRKTYKIATNSYLAKGGDGYKVFLKALGRYESSVFQRDIFVEHIKSLGGRIRPALKGRIKVRYGGKVSIRFKRAA